MNVEPVSPSEKLTIKENGKSNRYIIYMAMREKKPSAFSDCLTECTTNCDLSIYCCFQLAGEGHVKDAELTNDQT